MVGCVRRVQVRGVTVEVARDGVTSAMTRSGVTVGDCDVSAVTWCHRPRTCRHAPDDCPRDACDCSDISRRKFCLFCKPRSTTLSFLILIFNFAKEVMFSLALVSVS